MTTKMLEFQLPEHEKQVLLGEHQRSDLRQASALVEDVTVPVGVLQYEITYNESLVEPRLYFEEYEQTEDKEEVTGETERPEFQNLKEVNGTSAPDKNDKPECAGSLWVMLDYRGDDLKWFLEHKDQILDDLKEKRISSYETVYVKKIVIKVNPKTRPYIETAF